MRTIKFIIPVLIISLLGCNQSQPKKTKKTAIDKEEIKKELTEVIYPLPSPFELTNMLNEIEASYIFNITNAPENINKYITTNEQGFNIGIYNADLAYSATYNMSTETQLYLNAIKDLAKELDITGAIDPGLVVKVDANLERKDELVKVITDLFYKTYSYLHNNNNVELSYLILAGTWIEGVYLTANISDNTFENYNIVDIIMKQEESLGKLIKLIEEHKDSDLLADIYTKLNEIKAIYGLQEGTSSLSKSQLEKLTKTITDYRDSKVK